MLAAPQLRLDVEDDDRVGILPARPDVLDRNGETVVTRGAAGADMADDRVAIENLAVRRDHGEAVAHDALEAAEVRFIGARRNEPVNEKAMQVDDLGAGA